MGADLVVDQASLEGLADTLWRVASSIAALPVDDQVATAAPGLNASDVAAACVDTGARLAAAVSSYGGVLGSAADAVLSASGHYTVTDLGLAAAASGQVGSRWR